MVTLLQPFYTTNAQIEPCDTLFRGTLLTSIHVHILISIVFQQVPTEWNSMADQMFSLTSQHVMIADNLIT